MTTRVISKCHMLSSMVELFPLCVLELLSVMSIIFKIDFETLSYIKYAILYHSYINIYQIRRKKAVFPINSYPTPE